MMNKKFKPDQGRSAIEKCLECWSLMVNDCLWMPTRQYFQGKNIKKYLILLQYSRLQSCQFVVYIYRIQPQQNHHQLLLIDPIDSLPERMTILRCSNNCKPCFMSRSRQSVSKLTQFLILVAWIMVIAMVTEVKKIVTLTISPSKCGKYCASDC